MREKIHAALDKMLETPKSKGFLNHLITAYFPITNVMKVIDKPRGEFKCVLTKDTLISFEEILEGIHSETFKNDFMTFIKTMFDESSDKTTPMANLIGEKKLGITGKDTTTYMSYGAYQEFYSWLVNKILGGHKHINWLVNKIRRESEGGVALPSKPKRVREPEPDINMSSSYQLGEMGVFKDLMAKFKDNEVHPSE